MPHSHQHGNCEHEATELDVDPLEMGIQYSLFEKIDFNNLVRKIKIINLLKLQLYFL